MIRQKFDFSTIDIFDINIVHQMQFDNLPKKEMSTLLRILNKLIQLSKIFLNNRKIISSGKVLFYGASSNNQKSFTTILDNLNENEYNLIKSDDDYPIVKSIYLSFPYIFTLFKIYRFSNEEQKKLISSDPVKYLFSFGKMKIAFKIMEDYNPSLLVMANDHSAMNRCLLVAANYHKVNSLYLQHAPVSANFPRLKFDYALLDGMESFEKYGKISKEGSKVLLSGATRYDYFYDIPKLNNKIGISINQFDDFNIIKELCIKLQAITNSVIVVRPHPNMIDWNRNWFIDNKIEYSDSTTENSNQYLSNLKLQISNVCGIHLDAVIMEIPTVQYTLSLNSIVDHYQFVETGLIIRIDDFSELVDFIHKENYFKPDSKIIQYFMASSNTKRQGQVGKFTANYIKAILKGKESEEYLECNNNISVYNF